MLFVPSASPTNVSSISAAVRCWSASVRLMFLGAKPDGPSRSEFTSTSRFGSTCFAGDPLEVVFVTDTIDKYFNLMATQYEADVQASKY